MLDGQQVAGTVVLHQAVFGGEGGLAEIAVQQFGIAFTGARDVQGAQYFAIQPMQGHAQAEHRGEAVQVVFVATHQRRCVFSQAAGRGGGADVDLAQAATDLDRAQHRDVGQAMFALGHDQAVGVDAEQGPLAATEGGPEMVHILAYTAREAAVGGVVKAGSGRGKRGVVRLLPRLYASLARTLPRALHRRADHAVHQRAALGEALTGGGQYLLLFQNHRGHRSISTSDRQPTPAKLTDMSSQARMPATDRFTRRWSGSA